MDSFDLTPILAAWPHDPGRLSVRRFPGLDGREKLQIRLELGIIQMDAQGRPDGAPSLLDLHEAQLDRYVRTGGQPTAFVLSPDECRALRDEAAQYHHRATAYFSLSDFPAVVRDCRRSLALFDLCRMHASEEADQTALERFRPQVIMMRTRAEAEAAMQAGVPRDALAALDAGISEIQRHLHEAGEPGSAEHSNELALLSSMREVLMPRLPASQRSELEARLRAAIAAENYELAAILRDEIRQLRG
ncbi:MAG: UvrB/UvrC motif-containing protein [Phycisphaeraceae bacterium]|nr:UvrB/UvrC motif-containing protein [Phycisphaeraceae bacterium]